MSKVDSLKQFINELNSTVNVTTHNFLLNKDCALNVVRPYNIVVDCSDNPATRYLVNDACVILKKPLVSGSALRWEGQLTVYNYVNAAGERGPCYRCLFPTPVKPSHVTNCSEGGVLGPVVGVIGSLQALEVLKIAAKLEPSFSSKLFLFDGKLGKSRTITIRPRNKDCIVCGDHPSITTLIDYEDFCGLRACDKAKYSCMINIFFSDHKSVLVDTRPPHEFRIASLKEAKNVTLDELRQSDPSRIREKLGLNCVDDSPEEVFVICHRGNDSQIAVQILKEKLKPLRIRDIRGGYEAWAAEIDEHFPHY
ncbi:unnamed protein product [Strongylus vulgaris]|uniref:Rhodanese domain-containing protein n=1 Tax=Strongylus vulgaris TaxID=40348 RepID=A0A3P7IPI5_STRVU|nr:unnamed protein product [Strongylus vulgaris]